MFDISKFRLWVFVLESNSGRTGEMTEELNIAKSLLQQFIGSSLDGQQHLFSSTQATSLLAC